MSLRILQQSLFSESPRVTEATGLHARGCARQIVNLSFSLCSSTPQRIAVHTSPGVEAYWVKVWTQPGLGLQRSELRHFPELLLKDDGDSLRGSYSWQKPDWRPWRRSRPYYQGPNLRNTGFPCFGLRPGCPEQVWLQVQLGSTPGSSQAWVEIEGLSEPGLLGRLPLTLEVLPFPLLESPQDRLLWYRGSLDRDNHQHALTQPQMERQLLQIREAGFSSLTLGETRPALAQKVLDLAQAVGFRRNIVLLEPHPPRTLKFGHLKPIYYLSDELDGHGSETLQAHRRNHSIVKGWGTTMASLLSPQSLGKLAGCQPDLVALSISHSALLLEVLRNFPERWPRPLYFYWPAHLEKPALHRLLAGVGLWVSGADGISPYCYQHLPQYPSDPFDDRQPWESNFRLQGKVQDMRHHLTTYPGQQGPIATVQWEGMREGLLDLAYLNTWQAQLQEWQARFPERVEASRRALRKHLPMIDWGKIQPASPQREPLADFSTDCLDALRNWLINDILEYRQSRP